MNKLPVFNLEPTALAKSINELYGNTLTPEQSQEAADNLRQFFEVLIQVDRSNEERKNAANKRNTDYAS